MRLACSPISTQCCHSEWMEKFCSETGSKQEKILAVSASERIVSSPSSVTAWARLWTCWRTPKKAEFTICRTFTVIPISCEIIPLTF
ncbi:MAG: hypothetical protein BWY71_00657 [Planctomycetes bacterium ADurb.Bin412]|nr:MAG: hypothetical protein BWY71_00657 [Planctomycetes bacterium ADurb.Bin412]